jgi:hypothetical protein
MSGEMYSNDGQVKVTIPYWGLKKDAIVLVSKIDKPNETLAKANRKVELRLNMKLTNSDIYAVEIYDLNFNRVDSFNKEADLAFYIPDADNDGILDGSDARVKDVMLARYAEDQKDWKIMETKDAVHIARAPERPQAGRVSMPVKDAVYYRLISYLAPADNIDNVLIYPNPFRPAHGQTDITFLRLPADVTITIYNMAGELIKHFESPDQGQIVWDGTNNNNEKTASGVYLAIIKSQGKKKVYKLAIQR